MKLTKFDIPEENEVIIVVAYVLGKYRFKLAFDTVATSYHNRF